MEDSCESHVSELYNKLKLIAKMAPKSRVTAATVRSYCKISLCVYEIQSHI